MEQTNLNFDSFDSSYARRSNDNFIQEMANLSGKKSEINETIKELSEFGKSKIILKNLINDSIINKYEQLNKQYEQLNKQYEELKKKFKKSEEEKDNLKIDNQNIKLENTELKKKLDNYKSKSKEINSIYYNNEENLNLTLTKKNSGNSSFLSSFKNEEEKNDLNNAKIKQVLAQKKKK